jgi:hypothetical protein
MSYKEKPLTKQLLIILEKPRLRKGRRSEPRRQWMPKEYP